MRNLLKYMDFILQKLVISRQRVIITMRKLYYRGYKPLKELDFIP